MNKTALFFICLIAPIAFAQHDILSLIDKTPEGKEVLDHLFVQTRLMGEQLDTASLQAFLKANLNKIDNEQKAFTKRAEGIEKNCHDDKVEGFSLIKEQHERFAAVSAQVRTAQSVFESIALMTGRFESEAENLKIFAGFVQTFKSNWEKYFTAAKANNDKVTSALKGFINSLKESTKVTSFVQLPQSYHTTLAQLKVTVESEVDFEGMSPIVNNLLEIMQSENVVKPEVSIAVKGVVNKMLRMNEDKWDLVEQQNEHNTVTFTHLEKFLSDNSKRAEEESGNYKDTQDEVKSRIEGLQAAANSVESLIKQVDEVAQLRSSECLKLTSFNKDQTIKNGKISAIIEQVSELLLTQSSGTKSFFLQRQMRIN
jgi:hypothetical protein